MLIDFKDQRSDKSAKLVFSATAAAEILVEAGIDPETDITVQVRFRDYVAGKKLRGSTKFTTKDYSSVRVIIYVKPPSNGTDYSVKAVEELSKTVRHELRHVMQFSHYGLAVSAMFADPEQDAVEFSRATSTQVVFA